LVLVEFHFFITFSYLWFIWQRSKGIINTSLITTEMLVVSTSISYLFPSKMREMSCLYFIGLDPFPGFERGTRYSLWSNQDTFPTWNRLHELPSCSFS